MVPPGDWPVLTAQLAAVGDDPARYRHVVDAVLARRAAEGGEEVRSVRYFDHAFAGLGRTHRLPRATTRASPSPPAFKDSPNLAQYLADTEEEEAHAGGR